MSHLNPRVAGELARRFSLLKRLPDGEQARRLHEKRSYPKSLFPRGKLLLEWFTSRSAGALVALDDIVRSQRVVHVRINPHFRSGMCDHLIEDVDGQLR